MKIRDWNNKSKVHSSTALTTSLAILALGFSTPSFTQDDEAFGIEEIIVTAQKRSQSAQDVGISVAAVTGDKMRELGMTRGEDLAKMIPNVSMLNNGGGGMSIVMVRGIGLQNFRINDSPTTSFYVDEVYQTSIASAEFSMFDMSRVEMLKGPQGGLYGRNTIAGAIQVISEKPELDGEYTGYISAGYGSYQKKEFEGGVTIPISDKVAARASIRWEDSGDQYTHDISNNTNRGEIDRLAGRFQLRMAPNDAIDLLLKVHGGRDNSELPLLQTVGIYQNIGGAGGFGAPTVSMALIGGLFGMPGIGLCGSVTDGNGSDPATCASLDGVAYGLGGDKDGRYDSAGASMLPAIDSNWSGASLVANFDIGDYTVTSISAYDNIDYNRMIDADATPIEFQDIDYSSVINSYQQEFRLAYTGSDTYNWMIGANYAEDELVEDTILYGAGGILPLFFGGATWSPQNYVQKTQAFAIYGHGEYQVSEQIGIVGELRYTKADKSFDGGQRLGFADGSTAPFFTITDDTSFDDVSGKIGLNWTPSDDVLVYTTISRGFKTGGYFGGFATNPNQIEAFREETIMAYELGFKTDLSERVRFNGSVFYYDRSDVQMNAAEPVAPGTVSIAKLRNVGDIETYGAEVDLTWYASENLSFQGSLGYVSSTVVQSDFDFRAVLPLAAGGGAEGSNTPNYSKFSVNMTARYEKEVSNDLLGHFQAEYGYRSSRDLSLITNPDLEEALFKEDGYGLLNLRAGITSQDNGWRINAFIENVTDTSYRVEARSDGLYGVRQLYGKPRTWGVKVSYDF